MGNDCDNNRQWVRVVLVDDHPDGAIAALEAYARECEPHNADLANALMDTAKRLRASLVPPTMPPPVGLRPAFLAREARMQEIAEAIDRYDEAGLDIPDEWMDEYQDLLDADRMGRIADPNQELGVRNGGDRDG